MSWEGPDRWRDEDGPPERWSERTVSREFLEELYAKADTLSRLRWVIEDELRFGQARWVRQEDASGCGAATVAMLTGRSYAEAKATIDALWDEPKDWAGGGCSEFDIDRVLYADGFYLQRRYTAWRDKGRAARLPFPVPFAPIHYCMVRQPSNNWHFVVMLHDGKVLDPMREGHHRLDDWPEVAQVVGVARPVTDRLRQIARP